MNNKEYTEINLTTEQLDLLGISNVVATRDASYVLGLGQFYKISHSDDPYLEKYYITHNTELLPELVLEVYKEIIEIIYNRLNNKYDNNK